MRSTKRLLALILAGVMALALAACGNNGGSSTPAPAPSTPASGSGTPEPAPAPVEQMLKYGTDTWPAGFDPHTPSPPLRPPGCSTRCTRP